MTFYTCHGQNWDMSHGKWMFFVFNVFLGGGNWDIHGEFNFCWTLGIGRAGGWGFSGVQGDFIGYKTN